MVMTNENRILEVMSCVALGAIAGTLASGLSLLGWIIAVLAGLLISHEIRKSALVRFRSLYVLFVGSLYSLGVFLGGILYFVLIFEDEMTKTRQSEITLGDIFYPALISFTMIFVVEVLLIFWERKKTSSQAA